FAENGAHVGHLTCLVVEEHLVEKYCEGAKGECRESDAGDEFAVLAQEGGGFNQWIRMHGNSLSGGAGMLAMDTAHFHQVNRLSLWEASQGSVSRYVQRPLGLQSSPNTPN